MFANDLTEKQKRDPKYKLQKDKALTNGQRCWVNVMLRKNLGDSKVCSFLLNHGILPVLDVPLRLKKADKALLENMLEDFIGLARLHAATVSYTHLTLPTIYSV